MYDDLGTATYDPVQGAHIVSEYFPYIRSPLVTNGIVNALTGRFNARMITNLPEDKMHNKLIAVSNSPGTGKSTLLAHFADSEEYKQYVSKRLVEGKGHFKLSISDESPIICTMTFNSTMESGSASPGLRILYGTMKAMGMLDPQFKWPMFNLQFSKYASITAFEAVGLIRDALGKDRLMLILVDELAKATYPFARLSSDKSNDKCVMGELSQILNIDGRTDVVVSSLSPTYIKDLLTDSQRPIKYLVVRPLPVKQLGMKQFEPFALAMIKKVECRLSAAGGKKKATVMNEFCRRLILSIPVVASGHGRTVQFLIESLKSVEVDEIMEWKKVEDDLFEGNPYKLLQTICSVRSLNYFDVPLSGVETEMILSTNLYKANNYVFRNMLENRRCFVYEGKLDEFRIATTVSTFLELDKKIKTEKASVLGPLCKAMKILFDAKTLLPNMSMSDLWERCCSLTHVAGSIENVGEAIGWHAADIELDKTLAVEIVKSASRIQWKRNTLLVPIVYNQQGYDSMLSAIRKSDGKRVYMYGEYKISSPKNDLVTTFASTLMLVLEDHFKYRATSARSEADELRNIYVTLYVYGVEDSDISQITMVNVIQKLHDLKQSTTDNALVEKTIRYCTDYYDDNTHVLTKDELHKWLIPSVIPIAELVQIVTGVV